VAPGEHAVSLTFAPEGTAGGGTTLSLDGRLRFAPGRVVLVTSADGQLVVR
jgi:hypothetical protein